MAAAEGIQVLTLEFITFESTVLETNVIPCFQLRCTDYIGMVIFTFQGHLEVKNKMAGNVNMFFLPVTNINYRILKI